MSASDIKTTEKTLKSILASKSFDKHKTIMDLCKELVSQSLDEDMSASESDDDDMPDLQEDKPPSSCTGDHSHEHGHSHGHSSPAPPPAPPSPKKKAAAPEIIDEGLYEPEEEEVLAVPTNATDEECENLSDDDFAKHQDASTAAKASAAEASSPEEATVLLTAALTAESLLGQLSAMTIAKRSEQLLKAKRVVAGKLVRTRAGEEIYGNFRE